MGASVVLQGKVVGALLGLEDQSLITTRRKDVKVTFAGFLGDRHSGFTRFSDSRTPQYPRGSEIRNDRQVSILSSEELAEVAERMGLPELLPEWLGANLLLSGVPQLTHLPPNTRLVFPQSTVLVVQGENLPCRWTGRAIAAQTSRPEIEPLFPKASLHLRGIVACVEKPGFITEGDPVSVVVPRQILYQLNGTKPRRQS